jgi:hypothetical protein
VTDRMLGMFKGKKPSAASAAKSTVSNGQAR